MALLIRFFVIVFLYGESVRPLDTGNLTHLLNHLINVDYKFKGDTLSPKLDSNIYF